MKSGVGGGGVEEGVGGGTVGGASGGEPRELGGGVFELVGVDIVDLNLTLINMWLSFIPQLAYRRFYQSHCFQG